MEEGGGGGLTAHDIYQQVTGGPGTGSLDTAYDAAKVLAQREEEQAERIRRLAEKIQAGWQGAAAEGAYGAAGPLADAARDGADNLLKSHLLLASQSQTFNTTKNEVRPVPPAPPQSGILNDLTPWETDLDREIRRYQDDAQHNIAVYTMFDGQSLRNEQQLPREYPTISDWSGDISVTEPGSPPGGRPPGGGEYQPMSSSWSPGGGPNPGDGPNAVGGPPQPVGVSQPPQGTNPSDATTPPGTRPPIVGPPPPPGTQPPVGGPSPVGGWPVGNSPVSGRPPGFGPFGRGGAGGAEGAPGGRGSGVGGPGARGGAFGEPGTGGRPGAGPGAGAVGPEEAARRGGTGVAGARGAGGAGGFAPMGAGRGSGGEDEEHDRKYTIEPDPEQLFGTDVLTAPPVIGDEEEE